MVSFFRFYIVLFLFLIPILVSTQAIDNTVSFRNINSDHYFRIFYENDFFSGTDRDYTQGIYIESVNPALKNFFLSKLLWHPRNSAIKYGLALEDDGYTPNYIDRPEIQYGDRPYAGLLFLKTFLTATNTFRHERISVLLSTGLIGPAAGGEGMQKGIHHWINYTLPLGWHNQIRNDLVLNYQLNYEKEILSCPDHISLATYGSIRLGTLSSKLTTGVTLMAGNYNSPFRNSGRLTGKWQWFVYDQPLVNLVGYDATLQGGWFNRSSPYTVASGDINRLVIQHKFGLVLVFKRLYLEYFQTSSTAEFKTSVFHRTGGLQVGFGF
ncbi:lipid A deacylase LpxR family protein [Flavitalea flava]